MRRKKWNLKDKHHYTILRSKIGDMTDSSSLKTKRGSKVTCCIRKTAQPRRLGYQSRMLAKVSSVSSPPTSAGSSSPSSPPSSKNFLQYIVLTFQGKKPRPSQAIVPDGCQQSRASFLVLTFPRSYVFHILYIGGSKSFLAKWDSFATISMSGLMHLPEQADELCINNSKRSRQYYANVCMRLTRVQTNANASTGRGQNASRSKLTMLFSPGMNHSRLTASSKAGW